MPPNDNSSIDELKKSLYSRSAPDVRTRRKLRYTDEETTVQSDWKNPEDVDKTTVTLNTKYENHHMSFFTKLLLGSILFCVVAVGLGAYIFFNGGNLISADNIEIKVSGPVSIPGGEPVTFDVIAINKNNVDLQLVDMSINFPDGTVESNNPTQILSNYRKLIGDIKAGGNARESVNAIIFGEENLKKEILVTLTYGVKGSTAVFTKTQTYDVIINSSPINVTVSSFKDITSGQEFDMKVNIKSNSKETLKNIVLKSVYPFGYQYISSSIPTLGDKSTWKVGDIRAGQEKVVTIRGKLSGEDGDLRAFHFTVGAGSATDERAIGTQYMVTEQDITIEKPFISLNLAIGNDQTNKDYAGKYEQSENVDINWFNNLQDSISNVEIRVKLSGSAYSKSFIFPDSGYFNSSTDEIIWNQKTNSSLASIGGGENGKVSFSLIPKDLGTNTNRIVNPKITMVATVSGSRIQETSAPQAVNAAVTKNILVTSNVDLTGRIVRTVGAFANTGFIPPKVDNPTTYTVILAVDNTSNMLKNTVVKATLPPYVKWLKAISPQTEDIVYDENSGEITWNIGNVDTFILNSSKRKEVAFQISLLPSANQIGQSPVLVNRAILTATDSVTNVELESSQDSLTTRFSTDPSYKQGEETVVK